MGHRAPPGRAAASWGSPSAARLHPPVPLAPARKPPCQTWRTFLANHAHRSGRRTCSPCPPSPSARGASCSSSRHDRRELVRCRVTAQPTGGLGVAAAHRGDGVGPSPEVPGAGSRCRLRARLRRAGRGLGIRTLLTPFRSPQANAIAERAIRTLRTECLGHVLVLHERHLEEVLQEYAIYYNRARPHRSLGLGAAGARRPRRPAARERTRAHHRPLRARRIASRVRARGVARTDFLRLTGHRRHGPAARWWACSCLPLPARSGTALPSRRSRPGRAPLPRWRPGASRPWRPGRAPRGTGGLSAGTGPPGRRRTPRRSGRSASSAA